MGFFESFKGFFVMVHGVLRELLRVGPWVSSCWSLGSFVWVLGFLLVGPS